MAFRVFISFLIILLIPNFSFANETNDFYIQQALAHYFTLPTEVRSLATGGSTDASCNGSSCLYLNPAGLASLSNTEFVLSASSRKSTGDEFLEEDSIEELTNDGYGLVAIPLKSNASDLGVISFGYSRYQGKVNDRISTTPDGYRLTGAYALDFHSVNVGYSLTFYDDQLHTDISDLHSHSRFLHVFGAQHELSDTLTIGATFKLGVGQSDTEELTTKANGLSHLKQFTGNVGLTKKLEQITLAGSLDYTRVQSRGNLDNTAPEIVYGRDESGDVYGIRTGAELKVIEQLPIRLGMRWYRVGNYNFEDSKLGDLSGAVNGMGYSGGMGYHFKNNGNDIAKLDYGAEYLTAGHGAWQHVLTLTVPFG